MKRCLLIIFLFIFVFSIEFNFLPIRLRWLLAIVGFYIFINKYKKVIPKIQFRHRWRELIIYILMLIFIVIFSSLLNGNFDSYFLKYIIQILLSLFSAYAFLYLVKRGLNIELSSNDIIRLLIHVCALQCLLSVAGFINPSITTSLLGLIKQPQMAMEAQESYLLGNGRILSIGAGFFLAGTLFALVIALSPLIIFTELKLFYRIIYVIEIFVVIIIGASISRTTLLGLPGFFIMSFCFGGSLSMDLKRFVRYVSFVLLLFFLVSIFSIYFESNEIFESAFQRAFSIYYIYRDYGELQSLESMAGHSILPSELKTWIIGDGLMLDPNNPELAYYMGQDRGVNRVIFGIGIIGLLIYSLIQLSLCKLARMNKFVTLIIFGYYCAFMIKGIYSLDTFLSIFIISNFLIDQKHHSNQLLDNNTR